MGTNYYFKPTKLQEIVYYLSDRESFHVGKQSFAGRFCCNCNITFCKNGNEFVHIDNSKWHDKCPKCDKLPSENDYCCSFSWDINPDAVKERCNKNLNKNVIIDEYNKEYTGSEFIKILERCKIQFTDSIGTNFC